MDPALRAAATGMQAQQTRIEVISNNLANVNTTGFKRSRAHFEDLLYQTHQGAEIVEGADSDTVQEIQIGEPVGNVSDGLCGLPRKHEVCGLL